MLYIKDMVLPNKLKVILRIEIIKDRRDVCKIKITQFYHLIIVNYMTK